jgi:hypothetical protein
MNALPISPLVSANHDKGGEHNHTFTNGKIQVDKVEEHVLATGNKKGSSIPYLHLEAHALLHQCPLLSHAPEGLQPVACVHTSLTAILLQQ